ncbi:unnamed protein product [Spirodela intermedia]|uniref:Uncharacterized protein n=1 Tax=Spirodela intermedia TaxID=51605 RepID=A0A7I8IZL6_SPIIN|nr:unnamed protein product [Spirodela intermedia]CAA6663414.1 unnamed protein product [Spirodela intermedia]
MEDQSWRRFSALSRRHQGAFQPRIDLYMGFGDVDGGVDDARAEFACPFCFEDFDIVGLCGHIDDEHRGKLRTRYFLDMAICDRRFRSSVCPVCETRVGVDMVGHITMQHGNLFKISFILSHYYYYYFKKKFGLRRSHRGSLVSQSPLSLLKKELREGHVQSLLGEFSRIVAPSSAAPDPLLSSFISNLPTKDSTKPVQLQASGEGSQRSKKLEDNRVAKSIEQEALSVKDKEEKARKSRFVRELVLSAMFHVTIL